MSLDSSVLTHNWESALVSAPDSFTVRAVRDGEEQRFLVQSDFKMETPLIFLCHCSGCSVILIANRIEKSSSSCGVILITKQCLHRHIWTLDNDCRHPNKMNKWSSRDASKSKAPASLAIMTSTRDTK